MVPGARRAGAEASWGIQWGSPHTNYQPAGPEVSQLCDNVNSMRGLDVFDSATSTFHLMVQRRDRGPKSIGT